MDNQFLLINDEECSLGTGLGAIYISSASSDRFAGLVAKASASGPEDPGFESRLRRDFFRVESYQ